MKKKLLITAMLGLFLGLTISAGAAQDLTALIRSLQEQIQALQKQLDTLQAEAGPAEFTKTMRRGLRDPEVTRLQEFLKTWPDIYPEGIVSGYFGGLTESAVKRFQNKYGIETVGIVGPKTRAKLNELIKEKAAAIPPSQIPETPKPTEPQATTTPPTLTVEPATTTPATSTPSAPPPAPAPLPTQGQLGLPIISFFGWGPDSLRIDFTHDPDIFTRSYAVYLRKPGQDNDTRFGPYSITALTATTTFPDDITFASLGKNVWQWKQKLGLNTQPEGTYQVYVTAVGNGGVESAPSPGRLSSLFAASPFDDLLQGPSSQLVRNSTFIEFPFIFRLKDPMIDLRYRYTIYDGEVKVWDSGFVKKADAAGAQASFTNVNNYQFVVGKTYRINVESFDNDTAQDSMAKQKTNDLSFSYARSY